MDDGGGPKLAARSRHPRAGVEAFHALPDGKAFLEHPGVKLANHGGLRLVDDKPGGYHAAASLVAVAVWDLGADDVPVARFLQLTATEPLGQDGSLVFGDGALDL